MTGNQGPFCEQWNIGNGVITETFLRSMCLHRLLSQAQAILATSSESLDNVVISRYYFYKWAFKN